jgi:hypothetical protein
MLPERVCAVKLATYPKPNTTTVKYFFDLLTSFGVEHLAAFSHLVMRVIA